MAHSGLKSAKKVQFREAKNKHFLEKQGFPPPLPRCFLPQKILLIEVINFLQIFSIFSPLVTSNYKLHNNILHTYKNYVFDYKLITST